MSDSAVGSVKSFISGAVGGVSVVLVGHPLDTIKVRMQSGTSKNTFIGTLSSIYKSQGARGLYQGMVPPLLGVSPLMALSFWGYDIGKRIQSVPSEQKKLSYKQHFIAGMVSGFFTSVVIVPIDRVKCNMQIQTKDSVVKFASSLDCAKHLLRTQGASSFYKGFLPTLIRDSPGSGVFFMVYDCLMNLMLQPGETRDTAGFHKVLFAGGTSGSAFWLYAIAPDTIKTKIQTSPPGTYSGMIDCFLKTVKFDGLRGVVRGLSPVMIRSFPANSACFIGYEGSLRLMNKFF